MMSDTEQQPPVVEEQEPAPPVVAEPASEVVAPAGPQWQTVNSGVMDKTDLMLVPGGYLMRSVWQIQGRYSMAGCAMVFVPGEVPEGFADSGRVKIGGGAIVF